MLGQKHQDVLMLLIKGWRKYGRALSCDELSACIGVSRSTMASRLTWLSVNGYMSKDHGRRPLKDIHGNELKMVVTFNYPHQKNLLIDLALSLGGQEVADASKEVA